jgi:hypothetical protein
MQQCHPGKRPRHMDPKNSPFLPSISSRPWAIAPQQPPARLVAGDVCHEQTQCYGELGLSSSPLSCSWPCSFGSVDVTVPPNVSALSSISLYSPEPVDTNPQPYPPTISLSAKANDDQSLRRVRGPSTFLLGLMNAPKSSPPHFRSPEKANKFSVSPMG